MTSPPNTLRPSRFNTYHDLYLIVFYSMFHITDWFSTILRFAGSNLDNLDVDGLDQWDTLMSGNCARDTILHNIILNYRGNVKSAAYREGDYKIIIGDPGDLTGW